MSQSTIFLSYRDRKTAFLREDNVLCFSDTPQSKQGSNEGPLNLESNTPHYEHTFIIYRLFLSYENRKFSVEFFLNIFLFFFAQKVDCGYMHMIEPPR